jgi:hypothetical protein
MTRAAEGWQEVEVEVGSNHEGTNQDTRYKDIGDGFCTLTHSSARSHTNGVRFLAMSLPSHRNDLDTPRGKSRRGPFNWHLRRQEPSVHHEQGQRASQ